jgi:hypothetical protein
MAELNSIDGGDSPTPERDPSLIGQRRVFYFNDNGQPAYQVYDLTIDDYLNPQLGDDFFLGEAHDHFVRIVGGMLLYHYRYSPSASIHIRPKLIGSDRSLAQPIADVVVVNNLVEPQRPRPTLDLPQEEAAATDGPVSLRAIFEVTAPLVADVILDTKRSVYERLGASEYWVIDTGLRFGADQLRLDVFGFQLREGTFQPIAPVGDRRWESKACRLRLEVSEDRQSLQLGDLRTGTPLPMPADDEDPGLSTQAEATRRAQSIAGQLKL